jgi:hypothetical protein
MLLTAMYLVSNSMENKEGNGIADIYNQLSVFEKHRYMHAIESMVIWILINET